MKFDKIYLCECELDTSILERITLIKSSYQITIKCFNN
jgi:hypothetical protein